MPFAIMKCLQALALVSQTALLTSAAPTPGDPGPGSGSKRIMLWDWTLTQASSSNPNIQASAQLLSTSTHISAIFNWNTWKPTDVPGDLPFQPMIRTLQQLEGEDWNNLITAVQSGGAGTLVHYLNEPERNGVDVNQAIAQWRSKVLPLRAQYGVKLVGPACASNDQGSAWLDQFYDCLNDQEKPDLFGLHFYTAEATTADVEIDNAERYIEEKHAKFNMDITISEIGSTSRDEACVDHFSKTISAWLDAQPYIHSYGFFGATTQVVDGFVSPAAQLIDTSGSWTSLGLWYVNNI